MSEEAIEAVETSTDKEKTKDDQTDAQYVICPCCTKPTLVKPVKVNDTLIDHFVCCMLSGVPFWHTYTLFNGKLSVTVTNLPNMELTRMMSACRILEGFSTKMPQHSNDIDNLITALRLYSNIQNITIRKADIKVYTPIDTCNRIFNDIIALEQYLTSEDIKDTPVEETITGAFRQINDASIVSAIPHIQLMKIISTHQHVYRILLDNGFDENFWEGIELA